MASFPTSIVSPTDPTSGNFLNSPDHAGEHQSHNAEIVAVETKIGTGSSTPSAGKVLRATGTGTSSWSQLDVTTDVGTFASSALRTLLTDETGTGSAVFGTSPTITTPVLITSINDVNNNEIIRISPTGSAVNDITVTNTATGGSPTISASGDDSNINLSLKSKGNGIAQMLDGNGNEVIKAGVGTTSAVNEVTITNAATGTGPTIKASGGDASVDLILGGKSTGSARFQGYYDEWVDANESWAFASASTITVPTDATTKYQAGDLIKLTQSATVKYFQIISLTSTVLTVSGYTGATVANSTISANYYAHVTPYALPQIWQTGTPAATGFASKTSDTLRYMLVGKSCTIAFNIQGTSNATTLTFTLPFAAKDATDTFMGRAANSGAFLTTPGLINISGSTATVTKDLSGAAYANTLVKGIIGVFTYEVA